jgi:hypothetical protein
MVIEKDHRPPQRVLGRLDQERIMQDINFSAMSADELRSIIAAAQAALVIQSASQEPMRVAIQFDSYNERRYSRPWIARVTAWPVGGRPALAFGAYVGPHGGAGEAEISARAGDIVRWGQKDGRSGNGTRAYWGVVEQDGSVTKVTEAEARKHIRGQQ